MDLADECQDNYRGSVQAKLYRVPETPHQLYGQQNITLFHRPTPGRQGTVEQGYPPKLIRQLWQLIASCGFATEVELMEELQQRLYLSCQALIPYQTTPEGSRQSDPGPNGNFLHSCGYCIKPVTLRSKAREDPPVESIDRRSTRVKNSAKTCSFNDATSNGLLIVWWHKLIPILVSLKSVTLLHNELF